MASPFLKLLVLKSSQPERLKVFYECLGVHFSKEQHRKGPVHFAGEIGNAVLEVYPLPESEGAVRGSEGPRIRTLRGVARVV